MLKIYVGNLCCRYMLDFWIYVANLKIPFVGVKTFEISYAEILRNISDKGKMSKIAHSHMLVEDYRGKSKDLFLI